ncbi:hypothetical protein L6452_39975 [Arctium lappa]|uniref:Uncharacterized protein n=1 Tax=Arctium lappa TaxID=4217 RepID=A0ACB8XTB0_ARCLA|nr:hypothetical protein L6452_39975 [Arctium lappa]
MVKYTEVFTDKDKVAAHFTRQRGRLFADPCSAVVQCLSFSAGPSRWPRLRWLDITKPPYKSSYLSVNTRHYEVGEYSVYHCVNLPSINNFAKKS